MIIGYCKSENIHVANFHVTDINFRVKFLNNIEKFPTSAHGIILEAQ